MMVMLMMMIMFGFVQSFSQLSTTPPRDRLETTTNQPTSHYQHETAERRKIESNVTFSACRARGDQHSTLFCVFRPFVVVRPLLRCDADDNFVDGV